MIEDSEKLKSNLEGKAEASGRQAGSVYIRWYVTDLVTHKKCHKSIVYPDGRLLLCAEAGNADFRASAIREAQQCDITVKGGKYLEAVAEATTIVFDKTGTLTKAKPTVIDVIPFNDSEPDELLRIAACLEEHFPHSMAKAVVNSCKTEKAGARGNAF